MATDEGVVSRQHSAEDLDDVFDVLSHAYRRAIIEDLVRGEQRRLDDLVDLLVDEDDAATRTDVRVALVHNHLPRLAAAGVVTYDDETRVVELDDAVAERAVLSALGGSD